MNESPTQLGLSDIINGVPLVDAECKPLSKLKSDRMLKTARKKSKKHIFKWGEVYNLISLVVEQLNVYANALQDIQNLPLEARVALDKNQDFVIYFNNLNKDLKQYSNEANAIIDKIPPPTNIVTESTHMLYLSISQEILILGEDVQSVLGPVLIELSILISETQMELTPNAN